MEPSHLPLEVGETVTYNNHVSALGINGTIVERVGNDSMRVKWSDLSVPSTHRTHNLKRVVGA
jgi:hypothetical protein